MKNLIQDYEDFIHADNSVVPPNLNELVLSKAKKLLNPSALRVFFKILCFQIGVGFFSLSVCHQFGVNPFSTEHSIDNWMMQVGGHNLCMVGCGVLFISLSLLAAGYFLTIEEIIALRRTTFLQILSLSLASLALFTILGAELIFGIVALWLIGGFIGGFAATETVWRLRQA